MPDLGRYAGEVLASYGVSLGLVIALVWASYARSARVGRQLEEVERDGH